jgi:hypothetical protein
VGAALVGLGNLQRPQHLDKPRKKRV